VLLLLLDPLASTEGSRGLAEGRARGATNVALIEEAERVRRHSDRDDLVQRGRVHVPLPAHLDRAFADAEVEEVARPDRADALDRPGDAAAEAGALRHTQHHRGMTEGARGA